ncbi:hypothetical protein H4R33_005219 [Dimargaris cristalligena]|nr:hypothetical protein H4R33_005219 [Dimargaris cristalligena]
MSLITIAKEIGPYDTNDNVRISKARLMALYHYAKLNKDDPLYQLNAWDFINPDHLTGAALAEQFPLLALVDAQPNGHQVLQVVRTLADPELQPFIARGWKPTDLNRVRRLMSVGFLGPLEWVKIERIFTVVIPRVISLVMARLATTSRFNHLVEFMDDLPVLTNTLATEHMDNNQYYHSFNRLAVVMAAVGQHKPALEQFTRVYANDTSGIPPDELSAAQSELVHIMRFSNFSKGAKFLQEHWESTSTSNSSATSSTTANSEIHEDTPEIEPRPVVKYNHMFPERIYRLLDTNQMVVAVLLTENTSEEVAKLPKKTLPTLVDLWEDFAHQMTPEKFSQLRRLAYASTQVGEELSLQVSVSQLHEFNGNIPSDF